MFFGIAILSVFFVDLKEDECIKFEVFSNTIERCRGLGGISAETTTISHSFLTAAPADFQPGGTWKVKGAVGLYGLPYDGTFTFEEQTLQTGTYSAKGVSDGVEIEESGSYIYDEASSNLALTNQEIQTKTYYLESDQYEYFVASNVSELEFYTFTRNG